MFCLKLIFEDWIGNQIAVYNVRSVIVKDKIFATFFVKNTCFKLSLDEISLPDADDDKVNNWNSELI